MFSVWHGRIELCRKLGSFVQLPKILPCGVLHKLYGNNPIRSQ